MFPRALWRSLSRAPADLDDSQLIATRSCFGAACFTYFFGFVSAVLLITPMFFAAEKAMRSKSWQATEAKILSSKENAHFRAKIRYAYSVDGKSYESYNINPMDIEGGDPYLCERLLAAYPVGTVKQCFFDPSMPSDSVLLPGILRSGVLQGMYKTPLVGCLILGTLLLICGYFFACSRSPYVLYIAKLAGIVAVVCIGEFYINGLPIIENSLFEKLAPPALRMDDSGLPAAARMKAASSN